VVCSCHYIIPHYTWASWPIIARDFGYMGLALYESVVPGIPSHKSIQNQLNGLPYLPQIDCKQRYYYPACANAALARMVHHMFGNASEAQNFSIDSLANVFNTKFKSIVPKQVFDRSVSFGRDISNAIYRWSKSDGVMRLILIHFHQLIHLR